MNEKNEQTLDPQDRLEADKIDIVSMCFDFFKSAVKLWYLFIVLTLLGGGVLYYRTAKEYSPMYECRASFTVATTNISNTSGYQYSYYYDKSITSQMATTFPYILQSDLLTDMIKQELKVDRINGTIRASAIDNSNLFELKVTSDNPQDALDILNSVINNYGNVARYVLGETELKMIEIPVLPTDPYNTNDSNRNAAKGAILGFLLAGVLVFLYSQTRDTIRKETEVESRLHVKCLGVIPKVYFKKRRHNIDESLSIHNHAVGEGFIECNRSIALRLEKSMKEKQQQVVLITSTTDGEGVSVLAHNLVYSLADAGRRVVLFEFGRHTKEHFKTSLMEVPEHGVEEILIGRCDLADAMIPGEVPNISYLRYKEPQEAQVRSYTALSLKNLLTKLRKQFDYIVIDAPSFARMSDVAAVAELSDNVVYVVQQDKARAYRILEGIEESCSYGSFFSGVVLTNVNGGFGGYGYGKYGKYGRYYGRYGYGRYGYGHYGYGRYGRGQSSYGSVYGGHYGSSGDVNRDQIEKEQTTFLKKKQDDKEGTV